MGFTWRRLTTERLLVLTAAIVLFPGIVYSQDTPSPAETLEKLQLQLLEVNAREDSAKLRGQQLDEALKPENIERSLAGVGSTRPEELREQRRRQLTIEKNAVTVELAQLAAQRSHLESAISTAQVAAYHQSAQGFSVIENQFSGSALPLRWLIIMGVVALGAIGITIVAFLRLRMAAKRS